MDEYQRCCRYYRVTVQSGTVRVGLMLMTNLPSSSVHSGDWLARPEVNQCLQNYFQTVGSSRDKIRIIPKSDFNYQLECKVFKPARMKDQWEVALKQPLRLPRITRRFPRVTLSHLVQ